MKHLLDEARDGAIRYVTGQAVSKETLKTLAHVAELLVLAQIGSGKWGIPKDSVDACRGIKCTAFYKMVFGECPVRLEWDFANTPLESLVKKLYESSDTCK